MCHGAALKTINDTAHHKLINCISNYRLAFGNTFILSQYRHKDFSQYRYRGPGDTFRYHNTTEYHDTDDNTFSCHLYFFHFVSLVPLATLPVTHLGPIY